MVVAKVTTEIFSIRVDKEKSPRRLFTQGFSGKSRFQTPRSIKYHSEEQVS